MNLCAILNLLPKRTYGSKDISILSQILKQIVNPLCWKKGLAQRLKLTWKAVPGYSQKQNKEAQR
jgi:hypothetical protein